MIRMMPRLAILALPTVAMASVAIPAPTLHRAVLSDRERQLWKTPVRAAEFSEVPHVSARSRCEDTQPPQALTTPDPLLVPSERRRVEGEGPPSTKH